MPVFNVSVKWLRETYKDIECNTDEEPTLFKAQLFALTGVSPSRQKLMVKGKTLGDDSTSWATFPMTNGSTLLLMGTRDEDFQAAPVEKVKFVEDMNETELASALELPVGLANLGNTCYMNATVQCLKTVPPLSESLKKFTGASILSSTADASHAITAALRDLYNTMDKKISFPPVVLLQAIHNAFPRFAERGENDVWAQQDANECWTEIVRMLEQKLPPHTPGKYNSVIGQFFGGKLSVEWKNNESEAEPSTSSAENFLQLSCFIAPETRYLQSGLLQKLDEVVTKNSPSLARDAEYTKKSRIDRLPAYLTIQMVRFYYKQRGGNNAKILKDVKFPLTFDAFDLCTPRLQQKLLPIREKFKEIDDAVAEGKGKVPKSGDQKKEPEKTYDVPFSFQDDVGSNNSGFYELQAVLTHKGRSSSSGHYVAWIKHSEGLWLKCDDDNVSGVTDEEILKLSGGGDWHIAYVLLYGPKILKLPEGEQIGPVFCEDCESSTGATTTETEMEVVTSQDD